MDLKKNDIVVVKGKVVYINSDGTVDVEFYTENGKKCVFALDTEDIGLVIE